MSETVLHSEGDLPEAAFTPRQTAVLECALGLLVAGGEKALTTAGVARAANCSKESLYKWFGDRDGMLAAVIAHQAGKVRVFGEAGKADAATIREHLTLFAEDLLTVLAGETSLALNRLAIGQASQDGARFGKLLLERGRGRIESRARALLESGRRRGHLRFDGADEAYHTLYGLIVGDLHIRMLLGDRRPAGERDFSRQAVAAINQFYRLYGSGNEIRAGI